MVSVRLRQYSCATETVRWSSYALARCTFMMVYHQDRRNSFRSPFELTKLLMRGGERYSAGRRHPC